MLQITKGFCLVTDGECSIVEIEENLFHFYRNNKETTLKNGFLNLTAKIQKLYNLYLKGQNKKETTKSMRFHIYPLDDEWKTIKVSIEEFKI